MCNVHHHQLTIAKNFSSCGTKKIQRFEATNKRQETGYERTSKQNNSKVIKLNSHKNHQIEEKTKTRVECDADPYMELQDISRINMHVGGQFSAAFLLP